MTPGVAIVLAAWTGTRRSRHSVAASIAAAVVLGALLLGPAPVRAAGPVFGTPTMDASFGEGIAITQPVTLDVPPRRIELLLRYADSAAPLVIEVPTPLSAGATTLRFTVDPSEGHTLPNTPVEARWRITPPGDAPAVTGPSVRDVLDDRRFDWQTVSGDIVRVHWYEGGDAFGERALRIGEEAVAATADLLGVTEDEPVDFFIYANQSDFYDALGPGTRENVGGQAVASIRTLFALITPGEIDDPWVANVVPHELVHLVFDTAADNPYHFPPRWLNEGLAVYLSQGYELSDRGNVERAAADGTIIPLVGLGGQFPTSARAFFLAYAESVSAVDFLIRSHGQDALVSLIRSYADGRTDDEAFQAAIGMSMAEFDAAWLDDVGAAAPTRHGPQPAPAGPQPAAWQGSAPGAPTAAPGAPTQDPGAEPGASGDPGVGTPDGGSDALVAMSLVVAITVVAIGVAVLLARMRRGRREPRS